MTTLANLGDVIRVCARMLLSVKARLVSSFFMKVHIILNSKLFDWRVLHAIWCVGFKGCVEDGIVRNVQQAGKI